MKWTKDGERVTSATVSCPDRPRRTGSGGSQASELLATAIATERGQKQTSREEAAGRTRFGQLGNARAFTRATLIYRVDTVLTVPIDLAVSVIVLAVVALRILSG